MSPTKTLISIRKVEGEVMLHDGSSGWVRASSGMIFSLNSEVTIKTGHSGRAEIANSQGDIMILPENSLKPVSEYFRSDAASQLISARDLLDNSVLRRYRLAPAI